MAWVKKKGFWGVVKIIWDKADGKGKGCSQSARVKSPPKKSCRQYQIGNCHNLKRPFYNFSAKAQS